jgi:hypothetical protein
MVTYWHDGTRVVKLELREGMRRERKVVGSKKRTSAVPAHPPAKHVGFSHVIHAGCRPFPIKVQRVLSEGRLSPLCQGILTGCGSNILEGLAGLGDVLVRCASLGHHSFVTPRWHRGRNVGHIRVPYTSAI